MKCFSHRNILRFDRQFTHRALVYYVTMDACQQLYKIFVTSLTSPVHCGLKYCDREFDFPYTYEQHKRLSNKDLKVYLD